MMDSLQDVLEGRARWCVIEDVGLDILPTLAAASIDAIVTDPPYASTGDAASTMSTQAGGAFVPREVQFYEAWAREHLREWIRILKPDGAAWFTCDWRGAQVFDLAAHKLKHRAPVMGVWDRGGLGMGHILRKTWEAFVVIPMPQFQRKRTDESDLWRCEWSPAERTTGHSVQKPEALMRRAIRLITADDGDAVVLDPFAGSGTTGVAAINTGRRVILIERDADYADMARRRCAAAQSNSDWSAPKEQIDMFGDAR